MNNRSLQAFRRRSLNSDPHSFNTGWEDVIVPYGMARAGQAFGDENLIDWAQRWFEHHHCGGYLEQSEEGYIHTRDGTVGHVIGTYCGNWGGPLAFAALHRARPDARLIEATRSVCDGLLRQALRLHGGAFAHGSGEYTRRTAWVDTLFYSSSVLAEGYAITGEVRYAEAAIEQALAHARLLQDPTTGAFFHDGDPCTGERSMAFWARGNGWVILAMADVLRLCPRSLPGWEEVFTSFRMLAACLLRYQHSSGLWRIVPENPDAHLETSGTTMILAGLASGLAHGLLDKGVLGPIVRGWNELQTWIDKDGVLQGSQLPAGCGSWETHKLSAMGERTYSQGMLWRLLADLHSIGVFEPSQLSAPASDYFQPVPLAHGINRPARNSCEIIDFSMLVLEAGETHTFSTGDREYGMDILSGTASIRIGDAEFANLGGRKSVFDAPPSGAYAGCGSNVVITAHTRMEMAIGSCPSATPIEPYAITPETVTNGQWGEGNTERHYHHLITDKQPSERLWFAEVTVADGSWATYPPHKHEDVPGNLFQEEMYYYRTEPAHGFGFCASFGGEVGGDHAFMIRDSSLHLMPNGYHTVTAAPGYRVCYVAVYAGRDKGHSPSPHPVHVNFQKNLAK
jgi:5-deoxy-glucuronate isomerase